MDVLAANPVEHSVAVSLAVLSMAVTLGLALGAIRFKGMRLGISGVLFSALLFGQCGLTVNHEALQFLRDFALIIFIYALGLQVGPGFITSLRAEGLRLNVMAVAVLVLGAMMTAGIVHFAALPHSASPGIYSGAFTTTAGLAGGQESLHQKMKRNGAAPEQAERAVSNAALAYSVGYPFGVVGPILVIVVLRRIFRIKIHNELRDLAAAEEVRRPPIETVDFEVTEPTQANLQLRDHLLIRTQGIVLSRLLRGGVLSVPTGDTEVRLGDIYRAIGPRTALAQVVSVIGRPTAADLGEAQGDIDRVELVVTRTQILRRSLQELDLIRRYGVTVARINRAGIDLVPKASLRLTFADRVTVVGPVASLRQVETELGNCPDTLNRPQLIPIFVGIALGVLVGSIPVVMPGLHTTLKIGLAGGPLLAAILLSQLGNLGSVVWYMPVAANALFRDFGLAVFLACVGLETGDNLVQHIIAEHGLNLVLWGATVTVLPIFIVALLARVTLKMNFITLCGWISGTMTSSPSLSFANDMAGSDAPAVSYAAVAPLATLIPIVCAQILGGV